MTPPGDSLRAWYFVHIPKTAGSTVRRYLEEVFEPEEVLFVYDEQAPRPGDSHVLPLDQVASLSHEQYFRYRVLYGHYPFRAEWMWHKDSRAMTFVRDPVARVISWFHYMRGQGRAHGTPRGARYHSAIHERGMGLPELWEEAGGIPELDNGIVRYIAGGFEWPVGTMGDEQLQLAIDNVENHFDFVGHAGRFDESMARIAEIFGRPYESRPRENASPEGPAEQHIGAYPKDFLERLTSVDRAFVDWVDERFFRA